MIFMDLQVADAAVFRAVYDSGFPVALSAAITHVGSMGGVWILSAVGPPRRYGRGVGPTWVQITRPCMLRPI